jgi:cytochrome c peroxidase
MIQTALAAYSAPVNADLLAEEPILPLPARTVAADGNKVLLGRELFHEVRLSKDNSVSCASCHDLQHGGVDGKVKSIGVSGAVGEINAPTVFNSGLNFRQFWNGRAKSLEEQVDGPIQNPKEMGSSWDDVISKLKAETHYVDLFKKVYQDEPTKDHVKDAIANFERTLTTPNSKFDRFLNGDLKALSEIEKQGYARFKSYGCVACHQGVNVGGNMYQTMGVMGNYFADKGVPETAADLGRYAITKREMDRHVFRVPSLRNIELTAPYFHDGSAKTLKDAIHIMGKYQLGRNLSDEDVNLIAAFLSTLTGEVPR